MTRRARSNKNNQQLKGSGSRPAQKNKNAAAYKGRLDSERQMMLLVRDNGYIYKVDYL